MPRLPRTFRLATSPLPSMSRPKRTRAPSAYNIFMKTALREVKAANPGVKQKEIMKQAAAMWRASKQ